VLGLLTVRSRFDDPDMWWHLKTGEVIFTTHVIPTTDLFSYTTNHHASIPHEWLSQLCIYAFYRLGGYSGLMLWLCLFTAAVLIAGYGFCWLYSGNAKVAFVGALTIWFFGTIGFAIRPQMIGYLLLVVELFVLHLGRTRNPRWFLALPPLFALWVNCHGSFSLGIAVAAALWFSSWFEFQAGSVTAAHWEPGSRKTLTISLLLSVAGLFLNPSGVKLVLYPLSTLFVPSVGVNAVSEWQPLQLGDGRGLAMLGVLGIILLVVIVRRSQIYWDELLMMALATWLAASHRRLLFPFGILVAPILVRILADSWEQYSAERDRALPNAVLIAGSLAVAFVAFPSRQNLAHQVEEHSPVRAVEFIQSHHLTGPMLNDYTDGGYLIWAAPEHPVFIDGRADPYEPTGVIGEFGKWAMLQSAPDILLDKYQIGFCLLARNSPETFVLPLLPGWKAVYSDDNSVIFARTQVATASSNWMR